MPIKQIVNQPNVIVFFTDQQRWDATSIHGAPPGLTPNFDRMAQRGTHIYHSFTCQPLCGPARSSLQTGKYATATGVYRNFIALPQAEKTLAHYFRQGGYTTGYIGKWHLADNEPVPKAERGGYEYWLGANLLEFVSEPYRTVLYDNDNTAAQLPGHRIDAVTDAAIRYIGTQRNRPFFLFISQLEPHHQNNVDDFVAPDGYREQYASSPLPPDLAALRGTAPQQIGGYYGLVKRLDEAFGRLLDALKSLELTDRTIILFTSDHGCHFKTRNSEYKRSGHEASIRVPTAFQGPGFEGGGRVTRLVSLVDLPPTLLDAAGLPVPTEMMGRSILPLLQHRPVEWPQEVLIQISETQVGRALRTQRWKYGLVAPDKDGERDSAALRYAEDYLYDLEADPYELTNLIGYESHRSVADALGERLIRRMLEAGEAAPEIMPAPPRPAGQRRAPGNQNI